MSIFEELNDVKLDLRGFEEIPLTKFEQKRILKEAHKKIHPKKQKKKWIGISVAVVATSVLSVTLTIDKGTIASMPFIGEPIEKYMNQNESWDYSSYKTAIGETAENSLGKLTLNEVMVDDQKISLSATFEPSEGVEFDYQSYFKPTVKVNGQEYTVMTGAQSIELNNSMFTIYNDVVLSEGIATEEVNIEIIYDTWRYHRDDEKVIEQPWKFDTQVSQAKLLVEKNVFEMNETVTLNNGEIVTIEKVITTPMSTAVYYDLSQSKSESIYFDIRSEDEVQSVYNKYLMTASTSNDLGDISFIRFDGLTLGDTKYFLVARNSNDELLSNPIPIN